MWPSLCGKCHWWYRYFIHLDLFTSYFSWGWEVADHWEKWCAHFLGLCPVVTALEMSIIIWPEETKEKTPMGTGRRIKVWGHVEGITVRPGKVKEKWNYYLHLWAEQRSHPRWARLIVRTTSSVKVLSVSVCLRVNCVQCAGSNGDDV